jgi:hypothetical protein
VRLLDPDIVETVGPEPARARFTADVLGEGGVVVEVESGIRQ